MPASAPTAPYRADAGYVPAAGNQARFLVGRVSVDPIGAAEKLGSLPKGPFWRALGV